MGGYALFTDVVLCQAWSDMFQMKDDLTGMADALALIVLLFPSKTKRNPGLFSTFYAYN